MGKCRKGSEGSIGGGQRRLKPPTIEDRNWKKRGRREKDEGRRRVEKRIWTQEVVHYNERCKDWYSNKENTNEL